MRSLANVFEVGFVPSICVAALSLRVIILDHLDTSKIQSLIRTQQKMLPGEFAAEELQYC